MARRSFTRIAPGALAVSMLLAISPSSMTNAGATTRLAVFHVPSGSRPWGIATGPDGNIWFTESASNGNNIGRLTPDGALTEFPIPTPSSWATGITAGADGNLWFVERSGDNVGRITPSGVITEFPLPHTGSYALDITSGPDGNVWFTEDFAHRIGRVTPSGVITEFSVGAGGDPSGITAGPDGNLWFTQVEGPIADNISWISTTGVVGGTYPVPTGQAGVADITAGPDGNLWFTEHFANKIGRITPTGHFIEIRIPSNDPEPLGIAAGPDARLWFVGRDVIGRVTTTGAISVMHITAGFGPLEITPDPDGNMWFSAKDGNAIVAVKVG